MAAPGMFASGPFDTGQTSRILLIATLGDYPEIAWSLKSKGTIFLAFATTLPSAARDGSQIWQANVLSLVRRRTEARCGTRDSCHEIGLTASMSHFPPNPTKPPGQLGGFFFMPLR
jgi:hypothetical protein